MAAHRGSRLLLLAGVATAGVAMAQSSSPDTASATTGRNVYMAGGQVRPGGPIAGDFVAIGGRVIIDQPVKGDAMAAGGAVDLRAPLGDDLRAVGGDVAVDASVGGEVFAAGGSVTVARGARIERAATLFGGSVRVDGAIGGTLTVRGQRIAINGEVVGDVDLAGEQIALGPGARIGGKLRYASPNELQRSEGATVAGGITRVADEAIPRGASQPRAGRPGREDGDDAWHAMGRGSSSGGGWVGAVLTFLALLASGVLLLLIFPRFAAESADTVRRSPGLALLFGLAALVAVPVLAVLLFITLLGIPLGIALLALYPLLLLGGYVVGVYFIARRAQAALRPAETAPSQAMTLGFFALALLLVTLLGRLPFVGGLVMAVIALLGIGACLLEIYRRRQVAAGAPPTVAAA